MTEAKSYKLLQKGLEIDHLISDHRSTSRVSAVLRVVCATLRLSAPFMANATVAASSHKTGE